MLPSHLAGDKQPKLKIHLHLKAGLSLGTRQKVKCSSVSSSARCFATNSLKGWAVISFLSLSSTQGTVIMTTDERQCRAMRSRYTCVYTHTHTHFCSCTLLNSKARFRTDCRSGLGSCHFCGLCFLLITQNILQLVAINTSSWLKSTLES